MQPPPILHLLEPLPLAPFSRLPIRVRIRRKDNDGEFRVREHRAPVVEEVVDGEFDAGPHDPA